MQEKILVGHKLRRVRQSVNLSQTAMAEALDISPSYLNLLEHNQRPLTVSLLLRLGNAFDIDMKDFAEDDSTALMGEMGEVFGDPLLASERVSRRELQDMITAAPSAARGTVMLFQAYRKLRDELEDSAGDGWRGGEIYSPVETVRNVQQQANNYFGDVEAAAEAFRSAVGAAQPLSGGNTMQKLISYAADELNLRIRVMPVSVMNRELRRYDLHRRDILLSEALSRSQRLFHLLVQLGLITQQSLLTDLIAKHKVTGPDSGSLFRMTLASYFAAAVMMPYETFLAATKELRYDLDLLGRRFGASFEQVCHRLTSLNAPSARGIPFFFIRVDDAGNISKRLATGGMQFAKHGGTCPKWNVHKAFRTPNQLLLQASELPNGQKFFTIARTVAKMWSPPDELAPEFAVALGCEMHHARDMVYADQLEVGKSRHLDPIGIGCAVCERMECAQRAHPPLGHELRFDSHFRRVGLYDLGPD